MSRRARPQARSGRETGAKAGFHGAVRVLLADGHKVIRAGLRALLESDGLVEVVGEATCGEEAVARVRARRPDVVILELAMPGMDGIQTTRAIAAMEPSTQVLVFTIHDDDKYLEAALEAGAAGFLNKSASGEDIMGAVEALFRGHAYLPHKASSLLARRKPRNADSSGSPGPGVLSSQELTLVTLYAMGYTVGEMGRHEFLSPRTVEGCLARARNKLGLNRRPEIVRFALEAGLMGGGEQQ